MPVSEVRGLPPVLEHAEAARTVARHAIEAIILTNCD